MSETKQKTLEDALYDFAGAILTMSDAVGYTSIIRAQDMMNEAVSETAKAIRNCNDKE